VALQGGTKGLTCGVGTYCPWAFADPADGTIELFLKQIKSELVVINTVKDSECMRVVGVARKLLVETTLDDLPQHGKPKVVETLFHSKTRRSWKHENANEKIIGAQTRTSA